MDKVTLLDLPVLPVDRDSAAGTSVIIDTFLKERNEVKDLTQLLDFTKRWKNIWLLIERVSREEYDIVDGNFDYSTFDLFMKMISKEDGNLDINDNNVRVAMSMCVPHASLRALMLAKEYGVGSDLGFVRLFLDPYPEHQDALRA